MVKLATKYDINNNGALNDPELESLFSKLKDKKDRHDRGVGKFTGICTGAMYAGAAIVTGKKQCAKVDNIAKNMDKLGKTTNKNASFGLAAIAVSLGYMFLGGVIGKIIDKKQSEKFDSYKQELSSLNK